MRKGKGSEAAKRGGSRCRLGPTDRETVRAAAGARASLELPSHPNEYPIVWLNPRAWRMIAPHLDVPSFGTRGLAVPSSTARRLVGLLERLSALRSASLASLRGLHSVLPQITEAITHSSHGLALVRQLANPVLARQVAIHEQMHLFHARYGVRSKANCRELFSAIPPYAVAVLRDTYGPLTAELAIDEALAFAASGGGWRIGMKNDEPLHWFRLYLRRLCAERGTSAVALLPRVDAGLCLRLE